MILLITGRTIGHSSGSFGFLNVVAKRKFRSASSKHKVPRLRAPGRFALRRTPLGVTGKLRAIGWDNCFGYHAVIPMSSTVFMFFLVFIAGSLAHASEKAALGSWEGESKCTVRDSPCHDEHVLYQISQDRKDPFQLNIDAYKMVDGTPDFMGTIACSYESKTAALSCTSSNKDDNDWEFHITGDMMAGRLLIDHGKTLYRRVMLHRVPK